MPTKLLFLMLFAPLNMPIKLSLSIVTHFGKYTDKVSSKALFTLLLSLISVPKMPLFVTHFGKNSAKVSLRVLFILLNMPTKLHFLMLFAPQNMPIKMSFFIVTHFGKITGKVSSKALFTLLLSLIPVPKMPLFHVVTRHN